MTNLTKKIEKILDSELNLKKDSSGQYIGEIYMDDNDMYIEDKQTLSTLCEKGEEAIYECIRECSVDCDIHEYSHIREVVKKHFTTEELDKYENEIDDFITDRVTFVLPEDFVWGSEVLVNIVISGYDDWNVDFSQNCIFKDDDDKFKLADGGIKWLIEQQGYNPKDFEKELNESNTPFSNKFYSTVYNELLNTTTSLNSLVTSTKMTLREFMKLKTLHEKKELKSLTLDKNCDIGLVDFWLGAGSVLEICLDKKLEIPLENIYQIDIDSSFNYGIESIYGMNEYDYWTEVKYSILVS